jgi:hypothetical protein
MPVSIFNEFSERLDGKPGVETRVTPDKPQIFRHYSARKGDIILVTASEDDTMAIIMRLTKSSLRQKGCVGFPRLQHPGYAPDLFVIKQSSEVFDYEPRLGETALIEVSHFCEGTNN